MQRNKHAVDLLFAMMTGDKGEELSPLATLLLEREAQIADHRVNDRLLKELTLRYVVAEKVLQTLVENKNAFLGMAAHDMRNPLVSIRGFSELMLSGDLDQETSRTFLLTINELANSLLALINDFLDISHIESGKFSLKVERNMLSHVASRHIDLLRPAATQKSIALIETYDELPPMWFDAARIGQAVDNIVGNAVKYSPHGKNVGVRLSLEGEEAVFRVSDHGPGIADDEKEKMFRFFSTASSQPTGGEKSTGLGLAIVKKIIEAHNGSIGVEDAKGGGALFWFSLPTRRV